MEIETLLPFINGYYLLKQLIIQIKRNKNEYFLIFSFILFLYY